MIVGRIGQVQPKNQPRSYPYHVIRELKPSPHSPPSRQNHLKQNKKSLRFVHHLSREPPSPIPHPFIPLIPPSFPQPTNKQTRMLLIGLTGSISTGKSTVSKILSKDHALPIIDADELARKVVEVGTPGHTAIVRYFSESTPGLLNEDGTLNRAILGRRVFGDDPERKKDRGVLNGIVHPLVRKEMLVSSPPPPLVDFC